MEDCASLLSRVMLTLEESGSNGAALYVAMALDALGLATAEDTAAEVLQEQSIYREGTELSPRERQVLAQLAAGKSNKTIARDLRIALPTVKIHVRSILAKTASGNRTQAALWASKYL